MTIWQKKHRGILAWCESSSMCSALHFIFQNQMHNLLGSQFSSMILFIQSCSKSVQQNMIKSDCHPSSCISSLQLLLTHVTLFDSQNDEFFKTESVVPMLMALFCIQKELFFGIRMGPSKVWYIYSQSRLLQATYKSVGWYSIGMN